MRLIDANALLNEVFERHCKNCGKRKGMKNGQYKVIYEIGEAPCRACEIDDMTDYLENAPTVDATEVIRCKDCKHRILNKHYGEKGYLQIKAYCELDTGNPFDVGRNSGNDNWFCADAERK